MDELNLHKADYLFHEFCFCPLSFSPCCINIARLLHNAHPVHCEQMQIAGLLAAWHCDPVCAAAESPQGAAWCALNILTDSTSTKRSSCSECSFVLKYTRIQRMWN